MDVDKPTTTIFGQPTDNLFGQPVGILNQNPTLEETEIIKQVIEPANIESLDIFREKVHDVVLKQFESLKKDVDEQLTQYSAVYSSDDQTYSSLNDYIDKKVDEIYSSHDAATKKQIKANIKIVLSFLKKVLFAVYGTAHDFLILYNQEPIRIACLDQFLRENDIGLATSLLIGFNIADQEVRISIQNIIDLLVEEIKVSTTHTPGLDKNWKAARSKLYKLINEKTKLKIPLPLLVTIARSEKGDEDRIKKLIDLKDETLFKGLRICIDTVPKELYLAIKDTNESEMDKTDIKFIRTEGKEQSKSIARIDGAITKIEDETLYDDNFAVDNTFECNIGHIWLKSQGAGFVVGTKTGQVFTKFADVPGRASVTTLMNDALMLGEGNLPDAARRSSTEKRYGIVFNPQQQLDANNKLIILYLIKAFGDLIPIVITYILSNRMPTQGITQPENGLNFGFSSGDALAIRQAEEDQVICWYNRPNGITEISKPAFLSSNPLKELTERSLRLIYFKNNFNLEKFLLEINSYAGKLFMYSYAGQLMAENITQLASEYKRRITPYIQLINDLENLITSVDNNVEFKNKLMEIGSISFEPVELYPILYGQEDGLTFELKTDAETGDETIIESSEVKYKPRKTSLDGFPKLSGGKTVGFSYDGRYAIFESNPAELFLITNEQDKTDVQQFLSGKRNAKEATDSFLDDDAACVGWITTNPEYKIDKTSGINIIILKKILDGFTILTFLPDQIRWEQNIMTKIPDKTKRNAEKAMTEFKMYYRHLFASLSILFTKNIGIDIQGFDTDQLAMETVKVYLDFIVHIYQKNGGNLDELISILCGLDQTGQVINDGLGRDDEPLIPGYDDLTCAQIKNSLNEVYYWLTRNDFLENYENLFNRTNIGTLTSKVPDTLFGVGQNLRYTKSKAAFKTTPTIPSFKKVPSKKVPSQKVPSQKVLSQIVSSGRVLEKESQGKQDGGKKTKKRIHRRKPTKKRTKRYITKTNRKTRKNKSRKQ